MKTIEMKEIVVRAKAGTSLTDCLREAIVIAIMNKVSVNFDFNGKNYRVSSANLLKVVEKTDK